MLMGCSKHRIHARTCTRITQHTKKNPIFEEQQITIQKISLSDQITHNIMKKNPICEEQQITTFQKIGLSDQITHSCDICHANQNIKVQNHDH